MHWKHSYEVFVIEHYPCFHIADTIRIELADNASQRVLRIREEVDVTIDCTRVVESLINNNQPVNISELSLTWYLKQLSSDLMTFEQEERVAETPPPITPDQPAYVVICIF